VIITGRSDATLKRGGVRLGSSEIYAALESVEEIEDALVVHLQPEDGDPDELLLFVVMADGHRLDATLIEGIRATLRSQLSARHLPDEITAMPSVPKTLSGKKLEIPVKQVLEGAPLEKVVNVEILSDPSSIDAYARYATARHRSRKSPTPKN
jgi:acetoacetyl-CoA synthetase